MLLERSRASILAADVSEEFLNVLTQRERANVDAGRLTPFLLPAKHPGELYQQIDKKGWVRQVDALVSIDAMVHVDLQFLAAYFVTAAAALRPGGKLVMTLADATTKRGIDKLLDDIKTYYAMQGMPSLKFEYLSSDIIGAVLKRLGFGITKLDWDDRGENSRDLFLIAELQDMTAADDAARHLDLSTLPPEPPPPSKSVAQAAAPGGAAPARST
jgi:hypothetical protein